MKKVFLSLFLVLFYCQNSFAVPTNTMSVTPVAVDSTTITASDENTRNNGISTTFNAHSHTDITSTGIITTGTWNASVIEYAYLSIASSILSSDIKNGEIVNADISASAGIVYSKLTLTDSILNADIGSSAAIVDTKLAQITTASKVSGTAITGLVSLPSGAGIIPTANLGSGVASATKFLKGDSSWGSPSALSNVIYCWNSSDATAAFVSAADYVTTTGNYSYLKGNGASSYVTVLATKYKHLSEISTLTVWARVWQTNGGAGRYGSCQVDIGASAVQGAGNSSVNQVTPEWISFTLNVSGLTNNTTYDMIIQISDSGGGVTGMLGGIIIFAS